MRFSFAVIASLCVLHVRAEDDMVPLSGRWTNTAEGIEFFGCGAGREEREQMRSFCVTALAEGAIQLRYGAGQTSVVTVAVADDVLTLVRGTSTSSYVRATVARGACHSQLLALEAAKAVYLLDNPSETRIALADLVPAYLTAAPACASNGVYAVGPPHRKASCSLHGVATE